jgi:uncharacterized protein YjbJ (UPF0337 family)
VPGTEARRKSSSRWFAALRHEDGAREVKNLNSSDQEEFMNKDRIEGKVKDVAGRIERQAGEWTGDPKTQVKGAAKQVEGKAQNALGKVEDAAKKATDNEKTPSKAPQSVPGSTEAEDSAEDARQAKR